MSKYELISVILSLLAITISFYVYFKNNRFSTTVNTTNITISIGNAYNAFIQARQAHTVLSDGNDSLSKDASIAYHESKDSYLLTLDHACFTYFKHHLDHEYFDTTYKKTINDLFSNANFADNLKNLSKFPYLRKYQNLKK